MRATLRWLVQELIVDVKFIINPRRRGRGRRATSLVPSLARRLKNINRGLFPFHCSDTTGTTCVSASPEVVYRNRREGRITIVPEESSYTTFGWFYGDFTGRVRRPFLAYHRGTKRYHHVDCCTRTTVLRSRRIRFEKHAPRVRCSSAVLLRPRGHTSAARGGDWKPNPGQGSVVRPGRRSRIRNRRLRYIMPFFRNK